MSVSTGAARSLPPHTHFDVARLECLIVQHPARPKSGRTSDNRQPSVVKLVDREAVIDKLVYTATNPAQDQLVDQGHH